MPNFWVVKGNALWKKRSYNSTINACRPFDVTMSADMTTYRQALRDIPASTADSEDVVWPTKP